VVCVPSYPVFYSSIQDDSGEKVSVFGGDSIGQGNTQYYRVCGCMHQMDVFYGVFTFVSSLLQLYTG
jgi:hypothetical protein